MDNCISVAIFDRTELMHRAGEDAALAEQLIAMFIVEAPQLIHTLQTASAQHAYAAAHTAAHTLHGMSANLATHALRNAAAAAEHAAAALLAIRLEQACKQVQVEWDTLLHVLTAPHQNNNSGG